MLTVKNILVAILVSCVVGAAGWYANHKMVTRIVSAVENSQHRQDTFADTLNRKITRLASQSVNHSRTVIFDNDAASDDALALILIGNDPSVNLQAITVAGTGEAHGRAGAYNMAAIANLLGKSDIPVAYGHARPLSSAGKAFPNFLRDAMDHMLVGKNIKPHPNPRITDNAVRLIRQVVTSSKDNVTILATGPLTNIAEFVTQYPQLKNKIERIIVMGGAVHAPGNIEALTPEANNKVSEWNFYADPLAAKKVFASHIPITLISLDASNQVPMTRKFYDALAAEEQPELKLAYGLMKMMVDQFGLEFFTKEVYFWDGLAAMVMLDPAMAETVSKPLVVDATNGQVRMARQGDRHVGAIDVVTKINKPESALFNFIAMVKSNHIYAARQLHFHTNRVTANLGRPTGDDHAIKYAAGIYQYE